MLERGTKGKIGVPESAAADREGMNAQRRRRRRRRRSWGRQEAEEVSRRKDGREAEQDPMKPFF